VGGGYYFVLGGRRAAAPTINAPGRAGAPPALEEMCHLVWNQVTSSG